MPKRTNYFTDSFIKNLKPRETTYEKPEPKGLNIRVKPDGSKSWLLRYTKPATKRRTWLARGDYPAISLQEARERCIGPRELVARGIDPQDQKDIDPDTFKKTSFQWLDSRRDKLTPDYYDDILRSLARHLFPRMGDVLLIDLKAPFVIDVLQPVASKGSLDMLRRLCQRINKIMTYGVNRGIIEHNPLAGIGETFASPNKNHYATIPPNELPEFLKALTNANIRPVTRFLILWQLHTLTRPKESAHARWDELDLDNNVWTISAQRMKMQKKKPKGDGREHKIPLTLQMLAILDQIRPITGHSPFIFPADRDKNKPANASVQNMAIKRMGYAGRLVAHGLRSIGSTALNDSGFDPDLIETALSHEVGSEVRRSYNRSDFLERRRPIMSWWGEFVENALLDGLSVKSKNVIPMKKAK